METTVSLAVFDLLVRIKTFVLCARDFVPTVKDRQWMDRYPIIEKIYKFEPVALRTYSIISVEDLCHTFDTSKIPLRFLKKI